MRPVDFYALPTKSSEPWHQAHGEIELFFDDDRLEFGLDTDAAEKAGADAIAFERKLYAYVDHENCVSYTSVTFEGKPIGILVRGTGDSSDRILTDLDGYRAARAYMEGFLKRDGRLLSDVVDPVAEPDLLKGSYGHWIATHEGEVRLVDVGHVDNDGTLLFDHDAYGRAFDRIVRPAIKPGSDEWREGIKGERMRTLVTEAILESIAAGVPATDAFDAIPAAEGIVREQGWSPVLVAGRDHTFTVGVSRYGMSGFTWDLALEPVGPRSLYDELANAPQAPSP